MKETGAEAREDNQASKRIECPMLHRWAERGPLDTFYPKDDGPLGIWRRWAPHALGQAMKGGPEETPDDTVVLPQAVSFCLIQSS